MSWQQLIKIRDEARQIAKDEREKPLLECPYDGEPLQFRDGIANCPLGNYRTRRTTRDPNT